MDKYRLHVLIAIAECVMSFYERRNFNNYMGYCNLMKSKIILKDFSFADIEDLTNISEKLKFLYSLSDSEVSRCLNIFFNHENLGKIFNYVILTKNCFSTSIE